MDILSSITDNKLWLAPLAGYTNQAYRQLCKANGADVLVSEMVSADGLMRDSKKTVQFILFSEEERPFGIQVFGSDPLIMARGAEFCLQYRPDFIDLNMGCPVKKVVRRGAGSALMNTPAVAESIVKDVKKALAGACPLGVKFRSGWNPVSLNYLEFGLLLESAGADFLCLHPRTQSQMFSGEANWEHIATLKTRLSIPLIGNGDVKTPEDALKMFAETGCDSVMIGRGALGKPWIFDQIHQLRQEGDYRPVTRSQLLSTVFQHIDLALKYKPERVVAKELRSDLCFYTKGLVGSAELRQAINHAENTAQIKELILASEAFKI
ncbi:MAG: tRNA dihydrouridine synthase DusB [Candidatus Syntrophosphaera sp.]|nr:tRNA dihydrouridine synthase DusB [Candidatus Syntrophosphaera sp.]